MKSLGAEMNGQIRLRISAILNHAKGCFRAVTDDKIPDRIYEFDPEQTSDLMKKLNTNQLVAVIQHVFQKRWAELNAELMKDNKKETAIRKHINVIHESYEWLMNYILNGEEGNE